MNKRVRFYRFALLLPVVQLLIAIALWTYEPFQLAREEAKALNSPLAGSQVSRLRGTPSTGNPGDIFRPPMAGKTRFVLNLPARLVSDFLVIHIPRSSIWGMTWPPGGDPWYSKRGMIVYYVGLREVSFFLGVIVLWAYVGSKIDRLRKKSQLATFKDSGTWTIVELSALLGMAIWLLVNSTEIVAHDQCCPPERQIAAVGFIWPAAILVYCVFFVKSWLRAKGTPLPSLNESHPA